MKRQAAPIIAAILLLLPVLYVGSYLALVRPNCRVIRGSITSNDSTITVEHYRLRGCIYSLVFCPLEQIDRKVRPEAWKVSPWDEVDSLNLYRSGSAPL